MYVIAIANEKGGVARTTTALCLGIALAESRLKVLLIDLDCKGTLSLALEVGIGDAQPSISSSFRDSSTLPGLIENVGDFGVDLIPACADLAQIDRELFDKPGYQLGLRRILSNPALDYDYILIDCPAQIGPLVENALTAANLLLIPTQAEFFSIYPLNNMMSLISQVREVLNPTLNYRLLVALFDNKNRVHRTLHEKLCSIFGSGVLKTIVEIDNEVRESAMLGLPVMSYAPKSRAARQYRSLAAEIVKYAEGRIIDEEEEITSVAFVGDDTHRSLSHTEDTGGWSWETDGNGKILACGEEVLSCLGISASRFEGKNLFDFRLHPESIQKLKETVSQDSYPFEVLLYYESGRESWEKVRLNVFQRLGENGQIIGWYGYSNLAPDDDSEIVHYSHSKEQIHHLLSSTRRSGVDSDIRRDMDIPSGAQADRIPQKRSLPLRRFSLPGLFSSKESLQGEVSNFQESDNDRGGFGMWDIIFVALIVILPPLLIWLILSFR